MSLILPQKVESIGSPYIVACEGFGDVCFVEQLLKSMQIENCLVGCPSRTGVEGDGRDFLDRYLAAIAFAANKDAGAVLRGLALIVDADDSPQKAFDFACAALQFAEFPVPDSAFSPKDESGFKTAVYLIPGENETGTLEHLLLKAAFESSQKSGLCVDSFLSCIGKAPVGEPNTLAKMRMSALVAGSFPSNPWATPGPLLQSRKNDLVPINSPHFSNLADFLAEFCRE